EGRSGDAALPAEPRRTAHPVGKLIQRPGESDGRNFAPERARPDCRTPVRGSRRRIGVELLRFLRDFLLTNDLLGNFGNRVEVYLRWDVEAVARLVVSTRPGLSGRHSQTGRDTEREDRRKPRLHLLMIVTSAPVEQKIN